MMKQILVLVSVAVFASASQAKTIYVNKNVAGTTHDGTSWATAFLSVQEGVNAAASGDEIWVAASAPAAPAYVENVTLKGGVTLYGGFAGTEAESSQRDWSLNVTILDGNQAGSVIAVPGSQTQPVVIDGFTIRNGKSDVGGGIQARKAPLTVSCCLVTGNEATSYGGGIYSETRTRISECEIQQNSAPSNGGGIWAWNAEIRDNIISGNTENGVFISGEDTALLSGNLLEDNTPNGVENHGDALIQGNTVQGSARGIYLWFGSWADISHNRIAGNSLSGIFIDAQFGSVPVIRDNLITGNGSGVYVEGMNQATVIGNTITDNTAGIQTFFMMADAVIHNNIVAFNTRGIDYYGYQDPATITHNNVFGNTAANYSNMADLTGMNGNISADPVFVDRNGGDFHLQSASPCIDVGSNARVQAGDTDLDGKPRINGPNVDMGALEFYAPVQPPYTLEDIRRALSIWSGLQVGEDQDMAVLDADKANGIDLPDAIILARKVGGLESNP